MSTTLNDLQLLTRDYIGQYSTGTVNDERVIRAINRSIEYIRRQVSLPSTQQTHTFLFSIDNMYYDVPENFSEALYMKYREDRMNEIYGAFEYFDYPQILENRTHNRWSIVHNNGKPQILIKGANQFGTTLLESADDTAGWAVSGDGSDLTVDTYQKTQGIASLSFDVTRSSGAAQLTKTVNPSDLRYIFERKAFLKADFYITEPIDSLTIKVRSSAGNYYLATATQTDRGLPFPTDEWFTVNFEVENMIVVGAPDTQNITSYEFEWELPVGFSPAVEFRFDNFRVLFPEEVQMFFISSIKGTDTSGNPKKDLDNPTDILSFSDMYDDYADIIAQRAAITLWTQIRGDIEAFMVLRQDFRENMLSFTKQYPRRRVQGSFKHKLKR